MRTNTKIKLRQVLAASSSGMLLTGMMCSWGFPAAALSQMEQPDSDIHFSSEQASWFATITLMMAIPGSLIGGIIYEWGGPRNGMLALTPFLCASIMMMSLASWKVVLDAGIAESLLLWSRVIQSIIVAVLNPYIPLYCYEISDPHLRGMLVTNVEIWAGLGYLLCYIAGCFLTWGAIAWLLPLVTLVPAYVGLFLSPESPLWLARKGKEKEAEIILKLVRCTTEEVTDDLATIQRKLDDTNTKCSEKIRKAVTKANIKAIAASCLVMISKELGGYAVISIYVVYIFEQAGVGMDPRWSAVIVGLTRFTCNCFASFLMHNLPRKSIAIVGNTLTAMATFSLGIFFYLQGKGEDVSWLSWLPLAGLVLQMIGGAGAIGPCSWTLAVEVLPGPVRSLGYGMATASYAIAAFTFSKTLLNLQTAIGLEGVFWIFTGGSIEYIILILFYIPETRGRSLRDIEDYWEGFKTKRDTEPHVRSDLLKAEAAIGT